MEMFRDNRKRLQNDTLISKIRSFESCVSESDNVLLLCGIIRLKFKPTLNKGLSYYLVYVVFKKNNCLLVLFIGRPFVGTNAIGIKTILC